jgi:hypothetical protein
MTSPAIHRRQLATKVHKHNLRLLEKKIQTKIRLVFFLETITSFLGVSWHGEFKNTTKQIGAVF